MGQPSLLSKPINGEKLFLYLVVSKGAESAALIREEERIHWPVYYVSKRLLDAETKYPELEKLALAFIMVSRKLRPYFHVHTIGSFDDLSFTSSSPETINFWEVAQMGN